MPHGQTGEKQKKKKTGADKKQVRICEDQKSSKQEKQNKKIEILNTKMQREYVRDEVNIINAINNIEKTDDYLKILSQRSSLKDITFEFFENLKINDSDPLIKNRRLSILALLREKLLDIGDLRKLEGS